MSNLHEHNPLSHTRFITFHQLPLCVGLLIPCDFSNARILFLAATNPSNSFLR